MIKELNSIFSALDSNDKKLIVINICEIQIDWLLMHHLLFCSEFYVPFGDNKQFGSQLLCDEF